MKIFVNIILLLLLYSHLFGQVNWVIDEDAANFAILVLNYNDYDFEGGSFTNYQYYPGYDENGLPFSIEYNPPSDYGNILFAYEPSGDTIFYADIWWMGQGEIIVPNSCISSDQFDWDPDICDDPVSSEYFEYVDEISNEMFSVKADSAWYNVQKLSVIKEFSQYPYRVGIYLYAPSVGMFNPAVAKWIIFLYCGRISTHVSNSSIPVNIKIHQNYPNPFNPSTMISYYLPERSNVELRLFDILGREIALIDSGLKEAGEYNVAFDASSSGFNLKSGVYFYRLHAGDFIETKKMLLVK